jgi:hypothetical protein
MQKITPPYGSAAEPRRRRTSTSIFKNSKISAATSRVMQAMMQMDKIDIARLKQAYEGK